MQNLEGEYQWHNNEEYGTHLAWDAPAVTTYLDHFRIGRSYIFNKDRFDLIAEIPYDGSDNFEYFDNTWDEFHGDYYYAVFCIYMHNGEQCESEWQDVSLEITDVEENAKQSVQVYPNPTNGLLNVSGNGTMHITMSNMLGQRLMETSAEGDVTLDLNRYESGFYILRVETADGVTVQKVNLRK